MVDVVVRSAVVEDLTLVWEWRNDVDTRQASFQSRTVPLAEHRAWFMAALEDPYRHLLIAEAQAPLGIARFDAVDDGRWTVHINLAPQWRGRGLAAQVLRRGIEWLVDAERVVEIVAEVRVTNSRSQQAFTAAGFQREGSSDGERVLLRWRPTRSSP